MAVLFLIGGFGLLVVGVALLWSVPVAMIAAGAVLFVAGGLELRRSSPSRERRPDR
jgi:hypothetical protein